MNAKQILIVIGGLAILVAIALPWITDNTTEEISVINDQPEIKPQAVETSTGLVDSSELLESTQENMDSLNTEIYSDLNDDGEPGLEAIQTPQQGELQSTVEVVLMEEPVTLPDLNNSDDFVYEELSELNTKSALLQLLSSGQMIRKFVMLVDNVSRGDMPARDLPILGPRSELSASELGEYNYLMEADSYSRFDELVNTVITVESDSAINLYKLLQPLFDDAYAELGYPDKQFHDVLLKAINNVIAVELPDGPFELTQPSVHYEFADSTLESLSGVEKLLIRMGPENSEKLQRKLRELAQQL